MRQGFTLIEIIVVSAIVASLAALGMPGFLRRKVVANETAARATLKTMSVALETYAAANSGQYPTNEAALTGANPPYLSKSYCNQTQNGYTYGCTLGISDYTLIARPQSCTTSGTKSFTITTGSVLSTDATCIEAGG